MLGPVDKSRTRQNFTFKEMILSGSRDKRRAAAKTLQQQVKIKSLGVSNFQHAKC